MRYPEPGAHQIVNDKIYIRVEIRVNNADQLRSFRSLSVSICDYSGRS